MENKICKRLNCNNSVEGRKKYCSKECYLIDRSENNPMKNKETREKVSNFLKGRSAWNKGKIGIYSEETLRKIREARANQIFSEESQLKKSESLKKHWADPINKEKRIKNTSILQKGKILSEEHRNKIGESNKGKIHSEEQNLKMSNIKKQQWKNNPKRNKIAKFLRENRNKYFCQCSCGQKIKLTKWNYYREIPKYLVGHNTRLYEYNILNIKYDKKFNKKLRNFIKQRDMYMCQNPNCKKIHYKYLDIHHIDFDKKNSNFNNLITLCRSCHSQTNSKNNRDYWIKYYKEIITIYL